MPFDDYYDFRERLVDFVRRDLVGYDTADEIIGDPPITKYAAGILFPLDSGNVDSSEDNDNDNDQNDDGDETADPPVAMANVRYPSSMGMTFSVDLNATSEIAVTVEAGKYVPLKQDGDANSDQWQRIPIGPTQLDPPIDISKPVEDRRISIDDGLELFVRIRKPDDLQRVSVTLVLLNKHTAPPTGGRDAVSFFQPSISVTSTSPNSPIFVGRPNRQMTSDDPDIRSYRLLYRFATPIATGHGCSVDWSRYSTDQTRAVKVWTTLIPTYELLLADTRQLDMQGLTMKELAEGGRTDVITAFSNFCDQYEDWIDGSQGLSSRLANFKGELLETAKNHIDFCRNASERMRSGVDLLSQDDKAWNAFQLANQAMLQQRGRTEWLRNDRPTPEPTLGSEHKWYPFQLAFILISIRGIADTNSEDRDVADLLWFPTGGGKTEAYLGLLAFTVFLRRLRHQEEGDGVTVIMRYTMRLLTIQQFERAAMLICCCESIRRQSSALGRTPISIGLWVGKPGTPNKLSAARRSLDKIRKGQEVEKENPIQLRQCPWCGTPLSHRNYYIANHNPRLVITCKQDDCTFKNELPVHVVDEDIFRVRPTLLIATADKFASLPWKEQAASIFNRNADSKPPELIIQDELHLISGPLGTLAGLYETAIDFLCTDNGIRPKVIASTATIRRASSQGKGLFNRQVQQFPPPGIDASDSFFAVESDRDSKGSRLYVGLMAPATSQTTLLVRVYAALLQGAKELSGSDHVRDAYWSLVGYFNSLRVLGGARMQVQDDVAEDRIPFLANQSGIDARSIENRIELTSREPSGDIPGHLKLMEQEAYPSIEALDVVLATNMISVGVDVDRLGLMAVMGQPQSTSEYIQATSRVGRKYPGLVCVMFNAAKSRDRSHYESFVDFHSALYRQVESTSVTPFSSRARDRGLHAVLISLARLTIDGIRSNSGACRIEDFMDRIEQVKNLILDRVIAVTGSEEEKALTEKQLDEIIEQWRRRARDCPDLVFTDFKNPDRSLLVDAANADVDPDEAFLTPWSLRDVDAASNLYQVS